MKKPYIPANTIVQTFFVSNEHRTTTFFLEKAVEDRVYPRRVGVYADLDFDCTEFCTELDTPISYIFCIKRRKP